MAIWADGDAQPEIQAIVTKFETMRRLDRRRQRLFYLHILKTGEYLVQNIAVRATAINGPHSRPSYQLYVFAKHCEAIKASNARMKDQRDDGGRTAIQEGIALRPGSK